MKKILVVAPGHAFSTIDVFDGLVWGLRSHGLDVKTVPLHESLEIMETLIVTAQKADALPAYPRAQDMATAGIPGLCMAYGIEMVIVVNGENVPPSIPIALRNGGILTALLCTESPYQTTTRERYMSRFYDVTFTNERRAIPLFTETPAQHVHYMPHAYNPANHTPGGERADPCDVFFCGTRFPERAALLDAVDWDGIAFTDRTIWIGDNAMTPAQAMAATLRNSDVAAHYRSARISLNHHRTTGDLHQGGHVTEAESLGPRAYEIAACGGFMISDHRAELTDVYGDTVPTYTDAASLEALIRYYLHRPDARDRLATAQHQAVQPHHWGARAASMLDILTAHRPGRLWPVATAHAA